MPSSQIIKKNDQRMGTCLSVRKHSPWSRQLFSNNNSNLMALPIERFTIPEHAEILLVFLSFWHSMRWMNQDLLTAVYLFSFIYSWNPVERLFTKEKCNPLLVNKIFLWQRSQQLGRWMANTKRKSHYRPSHLGTFILHPQRAFLRAWIYSVDRTSATSCQRFL